MVVAGCTEIHQRLVMVHSCNAKFGYGRFILFGGQGVPNKKHKEQFGLVKKTQTTCRKYLMTYMKIQLSQTWTTLYPTGGSPPISRRLHSAGTYFYQVDAEKLT
jgi:hypothetical protein